MYHIFCVHSSIEEHLGFLLLLVIRHKAYLNIVDHVSLLHVGASSGYMPRNGIARSSGSTMSSFLRNCQTDFQCGFTMINSVSYLILLNLLCVILLNNSEYIFEYEFFM